MSDPDPIDDPGHTSRPSRPGPALVWGLVMTVALAGAAATTLTARTGSREVVASSIDTATADRLERELRRLASERDALAGRLAQIERGVGELKIAAARAASDPVATGSISHASPPQKAPTPAVEPPLQPKEEARRETPAAPIPQAPATDRAAPQEAQAPAAQPSPPPSAPEPSPSAEPKPSISAATQAPEPKLPMPAPTPHDSKSMAAAPAPAAAPVPPSASSRIAAALARTSEAPPPAGEPLQILPAPQAAGGFAIAIGWDRSVEGVRRRWSNLSWRYPRSLAGLAPRARSNRSGEAFELLAGPFASQSEAAKACASLAANGVPCNTTALGGEPIDRS